MLLCLQLGEAEKIGVQHDGHKGIWKTVGCEFDKLLGVRTDGQQHVSNGKQDVLQIWVFFGERTVQRHRCYFGHVLEETDKILGREG